MRERTRSALPYVLIILIGLSCVFVVALTAGGAQRIGWLEGADLRSALTADYNLQPTHTIPAADATRIAQLKATDEPADQRTLDPSELSTVEVGQVTPGGTPIAQVTRTATPTPTPRPSDTPQPTSTRTPTPLLTRTSTATRTRTPLPITPTPTFTRQPTPTNTPETPEPPPPPPPPPPPTRTSTPTPTFTPSPSPTPSDTPSPTPSDTPSPTPSDTPTPSPTTNPAPPAPTNLRVVNTSSSLISLIWSNDSAADGDFQQYRVYSSTVSGGPYTPITSTGTLTYYVDTVTPGTYYYIVRGEDTIQSSPPSNEASGTAAPIATPNPTPDCSSPTAPPDCPSSGGPPDGTFSSVDPGESIVLDLGPNNGILDGPGYDLVYYEREADPLPTGFIAMDSVTVELSLDNVTWYTAFAWSLGNENLAQNSNVWLFASDDSSIAGCLVLPLYAGAAANEAIYMQAGGVCGAAWPGLWGTTPQTGVAIDINGVVPTPTGEGYRYIRIGVRPDATEPAEIDGIERLH